MAIKYYDTPEGWQERGYKVTAAALHLSDTWEVVNRKGERLYSWGEVIPIDSKDYTETQDGTASSN
jgi:hypothetical protein